MDTISWDIVLDYWYYLQTRLLDRESEAPSLGLLRHHTESGDALARDAWERMPQKTFHTRAAHFYTAESLVYIFDHLKAHVNHAFTRDWCKRWLLPPPVYLPVPPAQILAFGAGICMHEFELAYAGYEVIALDVPGEHQDFAEWRRQHLLKHRGEPAGALHYVNDWNAVRRLKPELGGVFSYATLEHIPDRDMPALIERFDRYSKPGATHLHFIDPHADASHPMHRPDAVCQARELYAQLGYDLIWPPGVPDPGVWQKYSE